MANSCAVHRSSTWQALVSIFICVVAIHVADAESQDPCPPFSCGNLHSILSPFRRPGDPPECGVKAYELFCSSGKATIRINMGTYFVTNINYTSKSFWVVDANLDMHCPLPRISLHMNLTGNTVHLTVLNWPLLPFLGHISLTVLRQ